jgi:predicted acetyltransferase
VFSFENPRETHRARLHDIVGHAFGLNAEDVGRWFQRAGEEHVRAFIRGDDEVLGGLLEIPMGQYFGGRSISMLGVAGVAIAASERGQGHAARMMVEMLREAKRRGFAISTLYAASVTLYRRAGYERAGARFGFRIDPRHLEVAREKDMTLREVDAREGLPHELRALYTRFAAKSPGFLDRGPYCWTRIVQPRGLSTKTFEVRHHGNLEGYVVVAHVMPPHGFPTAVHVTDMAATTPRAARAILRFLIEYRSLADLVKWEGGPSELLANMLPERHIDMSLSDYFLVRIVDPAKAFAQRGYPLGQRAGLTFVLEDASMPENSGRYDLGGGGSTVRIDERGLAALYSGMSQAHVLADAGWLEADEETQALLDAWFAGPLPTMRDHF